METAVLIPAIILAFLFVGFCLYDIVKSESVRFLPKWAWAIICVISVPFGGFAYFFFGKA